MRRRRLVERLIGAEAQLAVIVAPPGYGKSALLSEWAARDPRPFVWLALGDTSSSPTPEAVAQVFETVKAEHGRFVLAIDDADRLAPSLLRSALAPLLQQLPEGSVLALASRTEPALPIGRMRAHRRLLELRMADLAMTSDEATILLRRAGVELAPELVAELVARTEGWPAALYLAALSVKGESDPGAAERFGGADHLLQEFLRDEVLSSVPPELAGFLRHTAVLDELSGPVCDDVLGERGSALMLAQLQKQSQLLVPLDRAHDRFRWQRLFGDALRAQLRRSEPELEPKLQLRASAWYARCGETDRAIDHAVAARDPKRTGDLLWPNLLSYVGQGRAQVVERWLAPFSHDRIAGYPPLALCAAHASLATGDVDRAQHWALTAGTALGRTPKGRRAPSIRTGVEIIDALVARGGATEMRRLAARAYQRERADSPWRPLLCLLRGVAEHLVGARATSREMLELGADLSAATAPIVASLCLAVGVMLAIEDEDWERAEELASRADRIIEAESLSEYPIAALVFAASAAVRAHQGRVDEAKHDLRRGVELLAVLGDYIPWYGADARILLAHASLWLADVVAARTLLAEASRLARKTPGAVIFSSWFEQAWAYMDTLAESSLSGPSSLTIAELRILRFLPSHRSFREIADQLGVSANTVKTQAHAVYRKLGAASRSEAVARALEAGLLGQ